MGVGARGRPAPGPAVPPARASPPPPGTGTGPPGARRERPALGARAAGAMGQSPGLRAAIVWLRNDLRLADHAPFLAAARADLAVPLFCLSPRDFAPRRDVPLQALHLPRLGPHRCRCRAPHPRPPQPGTRIDRRPLSMPYPSLRQVPAGKPGKPQAEP